MVKLRKSKKCYLREDLGLNISEILRMCTHEGNNAYVFFSVRHVVRNKVYVYLTDNPVKDIDRNIAYVY